MTLGVQAIAFILSVLFSLQKCTNNLSKQYKKKAKLTQKPAECVQHGGDLPDIRSDGDNNNESLSATEGSQTNQETLENGDSESKIKTCEDSECVFRGFSVVTQKKWLRENLKTGIMKTGSENKSDVSQRLPLKLTKKRITTKKNQMEKIEHLETGTKVLVDESRSSSKVVLDTLTLPTFKKKEKTMSLISLKGDHDNIEKKRKLSDACGSPRSLRKPRKFSKLVKGLCSNALESEPVSPSMKQCSVPLKKLSETSLSDSNSTSNRVKTGKCARLSTKRISKRISEVFQQCEKIAEVIDLDSDAEGELDGILQESQSYTQLEDEDYVKSMWTAVRSVKYELHVLNE